MATSSPSLTPVAFCLGSNLGKRIHNIRLAMDALEAGPLAGAPVERSETLDNPPWDCKPGAPPYLNAAISGKTALSPLALLDACLEIESSLGRDRTQGFHADRTIDIDIALYGDVTMESPELILPHPGVLTRFFFLIPLAEVASTWLVPPTQFTVAEHLMILRATVPKS